MIVGAYQTTVAAGVIATSSPFACTAQTQLTRDTIRITGTGTALVGLTDLTVLAVAVTSTISGLTLTGQAQLTGWPAPGAAFGIFGAWSAYVGLTKLTVGAVGVLTAIPRHTASRHTQSVGATLVVGGAG